MPNCFQLIKKGNTEPEILSKVDDDMRLYFEVEPDSTDYYCGWFDSIGFSIAMGKTFAELREKYQGYIDADKSIDLNDAKYYTRMLKIVDWLDANYTTDAFVTIGR